MVCVNPHHDLVCITMPIAWIRATTFVRSVALRCPLRCPLPIVRRLPVVRCARENKLFPTWLLTSEDEYKWYWHQMIYFPETINTMSTTNTISPTHSLASSLAMHSTYSVHAGILKPWRGRLPWPLVVFSSYHVFTLPLSGLNWRSLFPPWGFGPPFPKMAPPFTGSAHTPLSGSGTIITGYECCW